MRTGPTFERPTFEPANFGGGLEIGFPKQVPANSKGGGFEIGSEKFCNSWNTDSYNRNSFSKNRQRRPVKAEPAGARTKTARAPHLFVLKPTLCPFPESAGSKEGS